jgi:hypothetical protein
MSKTQSVTYSVMTGNGKDWAMHGQTADMQAAMKTARGLVSAQQASQVRVIKEFLDSKTGRTVKTTILDEESGRTVAAGGGDGGTARWVFVAIAMFAIGFGGVFAVKTFFL